MQPAIVNTVANLLASGVPVEHLHDDLAVTLVFDGFKGSDADMQREIGRIVEQAQKLNLSRMPS